MYFSFSTFFFCFPCRHTPISFCTALTYGSEFPARKCINDCLQGRCDMILLAAQPHRRLHFLAELAWCHLRRNKSCQYNAMRNYWWSYQGQDARWTPAGRKKKAKLVSKRSTTISCLLGICVTLLMWSRERVHPISSTDICGISVLKPKHQVLVMENTRDDRKQFSVVLNNPKLKREIEDLHDARSLHGQKCKIYAGSEKSSF